MHLVISYDIPSNRRRYRVAKLLKGCGQRVQYSVFEVHLSNAQLKAVESQLKKLIRPQEDSIRIYGLGGTPSQVRLLGVGVDVKVPTTTII